MAATNSNGFRYFGTDGIRGVANNGTLNPPFIAKLGLATGAMFTRVPRHNRYRAIVGKDTRISGYMIEDALVSGLLGAGVDVFQTGPLPTPGVAALIRSMRMDFGIMITASHNPFKDNGIKIFGPDGYKLSDAQQHEIEQLVDSDSLSIYMPIGESLGRAKRDDEATGRLIEITKNTFPKDLSLMGMRVVIDCANGASYKVAPAVLFELGADVVSIGVNPDGININDEVGSTSPEALIAKVRETRADVGIALDGDADRLLMVDEHGEKINGDQILAVIAETWKKKRKLHKPVVVATHMSNLGLERHLQSMKIRLARTDVGDRYVLETMREHGYSLGGEQSGHIILAEYGTTGDGLVAALQILAMVAKSHKPVSQVAHRFEPLPQILKSVSFKTPGVLESKSVQTAIAKAKEKLGKDGRVFIRQSGTEPVIRIMGEHTDRGLLKSVVADLAKLIESAS